MAQSLNAAAVWSLFMASFVVAQPQRMNVPVSVRIEATPDITNLANSYVSRELRRLGDVTVVDSDARYSLHILITAPEIGGRKVGYALTAVVVEPFAPVLDAMLKSLKADNGFVKIATALHGKAQFIRGHWLMVGSDLDPLCKGVVASFDNEVLAELRKILQRLSDLSGEATER